jgi:hypothetical protein
MRQKRKKKKGDTGIIVLTKSKLKKQEKAYEMLRY